MPKACTKSKYRANAPELRKAHSRKASAYYRRGGHRPKFSVFIHEVEAIARHPFTHHTHNIAYCVYYGIALAQDHGVQMVIVGALFGISVLIAAAGHSE